MMPRTKRLRTKQIILGQGSSLTISKATRYGTGPKGTIATKDMMTGAGNRNQAVLLWRFVHCVCPGTALHSRIAVAGQGFAGVFRMPGTRAAPGRPAPDPAGAKRRPERAGRAGAFPVFQLPARVAGTFQHPLRYCLIAAETDTCFTEPATSPDRRDRRWTLTPPPARY
jgi:hypothetical protein